MRRRALTAVLTTVLLVAPAGVASAADYPPASTGQGTANPSRVKQGQCTNFAGDGFAADAALTLKDDGTVYGPATADKKGAFKEKVCFANDARVGDHVLTADGQDATAGTRRVSATVTVTGVQQTAATSSAAGTSASSGTQDLRDAQTAASTTAARTAGGRTYLGASAGELAAVAGVLLLLVVPVLSWSLVAAERRHRRRRGERLAAA